MVNYFENINLSLLLFFSEHAHLIVVKSGSSHICFYEFVAKNDRYHSQFISDVLAAFLELTSILCEMSQ